MTKKKKIDKFMNVATVLIGGFLAVKGLSPIVQKALAAKPRLAHEEKIEFAGGQVAFLKCKEKSGHLKDVHMQDMGEYFKHYGLSPAFAQNEEVIAEANKQIEEGICEAFPATDARMSEIQVNKTQAAIDYKSLNGWQKIFVDASSLAMCKTLSDEEAKNHEAKMMQDLSQVEGANELAEEDIQNFWNSKGFNISLWLGSRRGENKDCSLNA